MALVYLHRKPSPVPRPATSHQPSREAGGRSRSSASQTAAIDTDQKNTDGASMVISKEPAVKSGVTLSRIASHTAAPSP